MSSHSILCLFLLFYSVIGRHMEYSVSLINIDKTAIDNKSFYMEEKKDLFNCDQLPGLSSGQQKHCYLYQDHMEFVSGGIKTALSECKWQFRHHRWNCTALEEDKFFLGPHFHINSREAAFAKAIISAGIVYSISKACKEGQLMTCGCSKENRPNSLQKDWLWGGCSDNTKYAYRFAEGLVDVKEKEKSLKRTSRERARSLANLHNNEAGRRAVSKIARVSCKCHGVSGSCSLITCWQQLPTMREIGDYLKAKYDSATKVKINRRGRLQIKHPTFSVPTVNDLVYVDESPNYCLMNSTTGSLGTQNRLCNKSSDGPDNCNAMCCGRGFITISSTVRERCNCKFHWCCNVECEVCIKTNQIFVCK